MKKKASQKKTHKPAFLSEESSDFVFNRSVFPESQVEKQPKNKKRKASKSLHQVEAESFIPQKKAKKKSSSTPNNDPFVDEDQYLSNMQDTDPNPFLFLEGKGSLLPESRLPAVKYPLGTLVLGAINDKGPNGLYMTVNLSRNKKAFISKEDSPVSLEEFQLGDYVLGQVIQGRTSGDKTQLTIRPESINETRIEFIENMVISATLQAEEDHGWSFTVNKEYRAFVKKPTPNQMTFVMKKPYLLKVVKKNKKSKVIMCELPQLNQENNEENEIENQVILKNKPEDIDIRQYMIPGTLVSGKIVKILENGLAIRLFKNFHGFIFNENLPKDLKEYGMNKKIHTRIVYFEPDSQRLLISAKENLILLKNFPHLPKYIGQIFSDFSIANKIDGGHYFLQRKGEAHIKVFISKKQVKEEILNGKGPFTAKIKGFNYLEGIYIGTMQEEFLKETTLSWFEIKPGDYLPCKIQTIKEDKLVVTSGKSIKGIIDSLNLSDKQFKGTFKSKFKENKSLKARVLSVDPINKKLYLTAKPIFLQESIEVLSDISKVNPGDSFYGYISGENKYGLFVSFFNNLKGLLTFKQLEKIDKMDKESVPLGKTIKVYVIFVDKEHKKMGLSLTKPENLLVPKTQTLLNYEKCLEEFLSKKPDFFKGNEEVSVGQIFKYSIMKLSPHEDFLLVHSSETKHRAFVHKDHVSDLLNSKVFDLYKKNPQLNKKNLIDGVIIAKILDGCPVVSLKKRLVQKYQKSKGNKDQKDKIKSSKDAFQEEGLSKSTSLERKMSIEEILAEIKIGQKVEGKIVKIQRNSVIIQIFSPLKAGLGTLHFSQVPYDPISRKSNALSYSLNQRISCKILSIPPKTEKKTVFIELTALNCHMDLEDFVLDEEKMLPSLQDLSKRLEKNDPQIKSQFFPAMIKSLSANSITPLYLELSSHIFGSICAFNDLVSVPQFEVLNNLSEYYHEKDICEVRIISKIQKTDSSSKVFNSFQLSLLPENTVSSENPKEGSLLTVKVIKALHNGLRVQYSPNGFTTVDLLEISDEFSNTPLERFPIGHFTPGRVLSVKEGAPIISLRESLVNDRSWDILMSKGTLSYKKAFEDTESQGDLRNRVFKLGVGSLKEGMVFLGYVHQTNSNGCFIHLAKDVTARAKLTELSDNILEEKSRLEVIFHKNRLVIGRILSILPDNKIDVSLRESVVKYGFPLNSDTIKQAAKVLGQVVGYKGEQAIVRIKGSKLTGILALKDSEKEDFENINQAFPLGSEIEAKVLSIHNAEKMKIRLGTKPEFLAESEEIQLSEIEKYSLLYDSIANMYSEQNLIEEPMEIEPEKHDKKVSIEEEEESLVEEEEESKENAVISEEEEEDNEQDFSDSEDVSSEEEEEDKGDNEDNEQEDVEKSSMVEEKDEKKKKKKTKKQKQKDFLDRELEIRGKEMALLNSSNQEPQNSDDFEKLLLQNPVSSYVWINYMAFTLEQNGIEDARGVAERAVKAMNFSPDNEKMNIWTAYLNMENSFGTEKSLISVFDRALTANNPKKVYFKMLEIYRKNEKFDLSVELGKNMIKKHKNSCKAWIEYVRTLMSAEKQKKKGQEKEKIDIKEIVKRALQSLHKKKHLKFLSHYARLDYIFGEVEKGRTTFEAIVTNYPKRLF